MSGQQPILYQAPMAKPEEKKKSMVPYVLGGLLLAVIIILVANYATSSSTPTTGPAGGTTPDKMIVLDDNKKPIAVVDNPSASAPITPVTVVKVAEIPVVIVPKVAKILITKDSTGKTNPGDNGDWMTFQIGEMKAYDAAGILLTKDAYASATYVDGAAYSEAGYPAINAIDGNIYSFSHTGGPNRIQQMSFVLKTPTTLSKIEVINRQDCCQARLNGTIISMYDANDKLIKSFTLTGQRDAQLLTM